MNRRRQEQSTHICPILVCALILAGVLGSVGGIVHVVYRNSQIKTAREIDRVERRIESHQLAIRTVQMRSDQILNLFAIRSRLEAQGTDLIPIIPGICEKIDNPSIPDLASTSAAPSL